MPVRSSKAFLGIVLLLAIPIRTDWFTIFEGFVTSALGVRVLALRSLLMGEENIALLFVL